MFKINKPTHTVFVDLEKAFDNVNWKKNLNNRDGRPQKQKDNT